MSQRLINIGTGPNTKDGDTVRQAFNLTNQNFTELYSLMGQTTDSVLATSIKGSVWAEDSTLVIDGMTGTVYTDSLINGNYTLRLDEFGYLHIPGQSDIHFATDPGGSVLIIPAAGNPPDEFYPGFGIQTNDSYWHFNNDGTTQLPGPIIDDSNTIINTIDTNCAPGVPTVVYTASSWTSGLKMIIVMEGNVDGDLTGKHTQTCEVIVASRGQQNGLGEPVASIYGVVYTSLTPLATVTARRNLTTRELEIVVTELSGIGGADLAVRAHVVDIMTSN